MPSSAESPAWYSRATLVLAATIRPPIEVAARGDGLRHLRLGESQDRARGDRPAEDGGDRAMEAPLGAAGGERFVDAPGNLVAEYHRPQHVAAAGTDALGHGDRGRGDDGANVPLHVGKR